MDRGHGPPHILAYDDDPAIRSIYAELLREEGYRATLASEPMADVADVVYARPDLVIVDLMAGREDRGSGFLARLRSHPEARLIPLLVCSGDVGRLTELQEQLDDWGCAVVTKPFDIDAFLAAVRSSLAREESRPRDPRDARRESG